MSLQKVYFHRWSVVGRISAFEPGGPGLISGGSGISISILGLCVFPLFYPVLSLMWYNILLTTDSRRSAPVCVCPIIWNIFCNSPTGILGCKVPGEGASPKMGESKY